MSLRCKNLKVSISLKNGLNPHKLHNVEISEKKTSIIFRHNEFDCVFTIYKHSLNCIHITGINSKHGLLRVFFYLTKILRCEIKESKIDNTMFSSKENREINLNKIVLKITNKFNNYNCYFTTELFPALFIKPTKEHKLQGHPTIILFHNCSYVIIGSKCVKKVKQANLFVKTIVMT